VSIDRVGHAAVGGFAVLRSGPSLPPRLLQAGSGTAQCADADGDGLGGLARLEITFRDGRSGETVIAIITPEHGDVSVSGPFGARILFPGLSVSGSLKAFLHYAGNGEPG